MLRQPAKPRCPCRRAAGRRAAAGRRRHSLEFLRETGLEIEDVYRRAGRRVDRAAAARPGLRAGPGLRALRWADRRMLHIDDPDRLASDRETGWAAAGRSRWPTSGRAAGLMLHFDSVGRRRSPRGRMAGFGQILGSGARELRQARRGAGGPHPPGHLPAPSMRRGAAAGARPLQPQRGVRGVRDADPGSLRKASSGYPTSRRTCSSSPWSSRSSTTPHHHVRRPGHHRPLFQWESQSTTSAGSPTGQRYIDHGARLDRAPVRAGDSAYISRYGNPVSLRWPSPLRQSPKRATDRVHLATREGVACGRLPCCQGGSGLTRRGGCAPPFGLQPPL